jgi:hypothetical protein
MMIYDERVSLMDIANRLRLGVVASCNCNTKTPEIQYHNELCPTRLLEEGANEIDRLNMEMVAYRAKLTPADVEAMTAVIKALSRQRGKSITREQSEAG